MNLSNDIADTVKDLKVCMEQGLVKPRNMEFCGNLVGAYERRGVLSGPQLEWVNIMLKQALTGPPERPSEKLGASFVPVITMFLNSKLKYPKIKLRTVGPDGNEMTVALSLAGNKAKYPGTITVTDGRPYGDNTWYGRIDADGTFQKGWKHAKTNEGGAVSRLLKRFGQDPGGIAKASGALTGSCCFCSKALTDTDHSLKVGFGPICAQKWGLHAEWKAAANAPAITEG